MFFDKRTAFSKKSYGSLNGKLDINKYDIRD